jgi:hypothetical protein
MAATGFGICEQLRISCEQDLTPNHITDLTLHTVFEPGMAVLMMDHGTGSNSRVVALYDADAGGWVVRHQLAPHRDSDATARRYLDRMEELSR